MPHFKTWECPKTSNSVSRAQFAPSVAMSTSGADVIVLYAAAWPAACALPTGASMRVLLLSCSASSSRRTLVLLYRSIEHYLSCPIPVNNSPSQPLLRSVVALSFASQLLLQSARMKCPIANARLRWFLSSQYFLCQQLLSTISWNCFPSLSTTQVCIYGLPTCRQAHRSIFRNELHELLIATQVQESLLSATLWPRAPLVPQQCYFRTASRVCS